jgi:hypothetical protein
MIISQNKNDFVCLYHYYYNAFELLQHYIQNINVPFQHAD